MEDDPYFGYDDVSSPLGDSAPTMSSIASAGSVKRTGTASRLGSAARLGTAIGRGPLVGPPGTALGPPGTGLRSATGTRSAEVARPVSAVKGAGYVSVKGRASISASGVNPMRSKGPSEAEACKQLEIRVHSLIEEAALCIQEGAYNEAHDKAKEAQKKAEELHQRYEANDWQDNAHSDLQFAVQVCLAHCAHMAGLDQEALNIYNAIVRDSEYHMPGRLRVNIGNIYFQNKQWTDAIKQYRMALDQLPNERQDRGQGAYGTMQARLLRNIGVAFLNQGMYSDARDNFEAVQRIRPNAACAFNYLICSFMITTSVEQADALKAAFKELIQVASQSPKGAVDLERSDFKEKLDAASVLMSKYIVMAAKIVAPRINPSSTEAGFQWCMDEVMRAKLPEFAHGVLMAKAAHFLAAGEMDKAVTVLKQFEKHSGAARTRAATNLSFIYLLEGNIDEAERYANMAKQNDEYHTQALVNLGNCKFERAAGEADEGCKEALLSEARDLYEAAARNEPDCLEAVYNIGLASKACQQYDVALEQFILLNGLLPNQVEVLYQIADLYYLKGDRKRAIKMFNLTHDYVGNEPGILARLGTMHAEAGMRDEALRYYTDSYELLPDMDVLALLCAHHVNEESYETAATYFSVAARMQPNEPKWQLMVASCHRRAQKLEKAFDLYEQIHAKFPENVEALRFLVQLSMDLQEQSKHDMYEGQLQRVERMLAMREDILKPGSRQTDQSRTTAFDAFGEPNPQESVVSGTRQLADINGGDMDLSGQQQLLPEALSVDGLSGHEHNTPLGSNAIAKDNIWDNDLGVDLLPGLD